MGAVNTIAELNGLFKQRYAPRLERLHPEEFTLQNEISFNRAKKLGDLFHQPVILQREHGVTYAASGDGAYTLDVSVAGQIKDAQVQGSQVVIRGSMDYESLAKGDGSEDQRFEDSNDLLLENMAMSIKQRLEISLWYGQQEIGIIASVAANVLTLTAAAWAVGIWSGAEGAKLEAFDTTGVTQRVGTMQITGVNIANKTVTVDVAAAGLVATDRLFFKTQHQPANVEKDFVGLHKILLNATTLFNINAGTFSLWQANTLNVNNANLAFESVQDGVALGVGKGLKGDNMLLVSPATWAKMLTDQAALRRYDAKYSSSTVETGGEELVFFTQAGKTTIKPSIYCREGFAYLIEPKNYTRIGASDVTFNVPGRGGEFFRQLDTQAGVEIRAFYHQALFGKKPGRCVIFTNIVNS